MFPSGNVISHSVLPMCTQISVCSGFVQFAAIVLSCYRLMNHHVIEFNALLSCYISNPIITVMRNSFPLIYDWVES